MRVVSLLAVMALIFVVTPYQAGQNAADPAFKEFNYRVQQYWDLHKKVEGVTPHIDQKKERDPADIIEHERNLADGIRNARINAAESDIFTPPVQKILIATIQQELSSGRGQPLAPSFSAKAIPGIPNRPQKWTWVVNGKYPPEAPLSTVPPSVLGTLPKLPEGLEYRFVGRHLILYDSKANLIVDILRNAIK